MSLFISISRKQRKSVWTVFTELLQLVEATFRFPNVYKKKLSAYIHFKYEIQNLVFFITKYKWMLSSRWLNKSCFERKWRLGDICKRNCFSNGNNQSVIKLQLFFFVTGTRKNRLNGFSDHDHEYNSRHNNSMFYNQISHCLELLSLNWNDIISSAYELNIKIMSLLLRATPMTDIWKV